MHITKFTSININAITAPTSVRMLLDFITTHYFDLVMLQEVTEPDLIDASRYKVHYNIETEMRGTAMMAKHEYQLTNLTRLPTGRAMAATYNAIRIINIYAPSGTAKHTD
jgi:exonuclease III